ncbi:MAG: hypothetical protein R3D29_01085 [Nitratireductor sp.]
MGQQFRCCNGGNADLAITAAKRGFAFDIVAGTETGWILAHGAILFDAVICHYDSLASGIAQKTTNLGKSWAESLSCCGFGEIAPLLLLQSYAQGA